MFGVITVAVVGVLIALLISLRARAKGTFYDFKFHFSVSAFVALFIAGMYLAIGISIFTGGVYPVEKQLINTQVLVAVDDIDTIEGTFVIGSGNISSGNYQYAYYQERDDGGYELRKVPASTSVIYEEDDASPRIETYTFVSTCKAEEVPLGVRLFIPCLRNMSFGTEYHLHVPEGSVVRDINFDF